MLTRKQHELLIFIDEHLQRTGFSPSFEEMKEGLQLRSKSGIHRLISALEERGFLRRRHHRARALEVMRRPEGMAQGAGALALRAEAGATERTDVAGVAGDVAAFTPNVIHGDFTARLAGVRVADGAVAVQLPLYGKIAAGMPIEALRDNGCLVEVPMALLGTGEHFALEVDGDSMIEAGILSGDTVLIRKGEAAETGQIVVALVNEEQVTLKRLRRRGSSIALEPANAKHETQIYPGDRVKVQGRLVGLLRSYS